MLLARTTISNEELTASVKRLLSTSEVNLLQLDYVAAQPARFSSDLWRIIHKSLYLRPDLQVVTNARGSNVVECMERLAEFLVEHGSPDMPIAAVRGENLLATLEEWLSPEADLGKHSVLSAQVEIGGGPLATALAEGARIVVAGAYDRAAPFLAAVVSEGYFRWQDHAALANLAAGSQFENVIVEVSESGHTDLEQEAISHLPRVRESGMTVHADVLCDYSHMKLEPTDRGTHRISSVLGKKGTGMWNVRMILDAGYHAAMLIEGKGDDLSAIQEFCDLTWGAARMTSTSYLPADSPEASELMLLRLAYSANNREDCQEFVDLLESWMGRNGAGRVLEPLPSIQPVRKEITTQIPSDEVVLSVDTRPAREWL